MTARVTVALPLTLAACAGVVLLGLSVLPSDAVAGRLMAVAGEGRAGSLTQELYQQLGWRLRVAAAILFALTVGLFAVSTTLTRMIAIALEDVRRPWSISITRGELGLIGGCLALASVVRAAFLRQPMRYDEALSFNEFASRSLVYGLSFYPEPNNHLLNTLLMHVSWVLLGNHPWVLRLPAVVAGILLVPATYSLGRILHDRATGLLAMALVSGSSYLLEYSTNARGYMLQALAFVGVFGCAIWAIRCGSPTALLLLALCAALGLYAVPTMLYGLAVVAVWGVIEIWTAKRHPPPMHVVAAAVVIGFLTAVLYLPALIVSGPERVLANRWVLPLSWAELGVELPDSLRNTWRFWNRDLPLPVLLLLVAGVLVASVQAARSRRAPLALVIVATCLPLLIAQRVAPFERVWLFLLPVYFIEASAGLVVLVRALRPPAAVAGWSVGLLALLLAGLALTSGSVPRSRETGAFPDAEAVTASLRGRLDPDDAVLTLVPASLPELQYYFNRVGLPISALVRSPVTARRLYVVSPGATDLSALETQLAQQGVALADWSAPAHEQDYAESQLYRLDRASAAIARTP